MGSGVSALCGGVWRYTFEWALDLFLLAFGERVGVKPWQVQQAAQETVSAAQDERGLQMDEKPKEQEERAVETRLRK